MVGFVGLNVCRRGDPLPSIHSLTVRLNVGPGAISGTCESLRRRNIVCAVTNGNIFMGGARLRDIRRGVTSRVGTIISSTGVTKVGGGSVISVMGNI